MFLLGFLGTGDGTLGLPSARQVLCCLCRRSFKWDVITICFISGKLWMDFPAFLKLLGCYRKETVIWIKRNLSVFGKQGPLQLFITGATSSVNTEECTRKHSTAFVILINYLLSVSIKKGRVKQIGFHLPSGALVVIKRMKKEDWRDGSAVKSACWSCREPKFRSELHISWLTTICNTSSGESDAPFWPPWVPTHNLCMHTHTYK